MPSSGTSSITKEEFKRKANQMWNARKRKAEEHSGIMRGNLWQKAVTKIGNRPPGQAKPAWRESLKAFLQKDGKLLGSAFKKSTPEDRRKYLLAF